MANGVNFTFLRRINMKIIILLFLNFLTFASANAHPIFFHEEINVTFYTNVFSILIIFVTSIIVFKSYKKVTCDEKQY